MLWGLNTAFCEACGHEGPQANRTQASARHEQARIQECNSAYTRCGLYRLSPDSPLLLRECTTASWEDMIRSYALSTVSNKSKFAPVGMKL